MERRSENDGLIAGGGIQWGFRVDKRGPTHVVGPATDPGSRLDEPLRSPVLRPVKLENRLHAGSLAKAQTRTTAADKLLKDAPVPATDGRRARRGERDEGADAVNAGDRRAVVDLARGRDELADEELADALVRQVLVGVVRRGRGEVCRGGKVGERVERAL